jgi:hypothetical protein
MAFNFITQITIRNIGKYRVALGDYDSFVVSVARPSFARVQK